MKNILNFGHSLPPSDRGYGAYDSLFVPSHPSVETTQVSNQTGVHYTKSGMSRLNLLVHVIIAAMAIFSTGLVFFAFGGIYAMVCGGLLAVWFCTLPRTESTEQPPRSFASVQTDGR